LYQGRIHPSCPVPNLSEQNVKNLHFQIRNIPLTAVGVNADSQQFPEDWLFRWRWGKGKKKTPQAKKAKALQDALEAAGSDDEDDVKPAGKSVRIWLRFLSLMGSPQRSSLSKWAGGPQQ